MPGNDQPTGRPERPQAPGRPGQSRVSRRSLLGAAGVGAAGLAAVSALGGLAAAPAVAAAAPARGDHDRSDHDLGEQPDNGDHVVVHVRGDRIGELDVYRGTSHSRVQDPDLAARLRRMTR
jgi:nitrous oxide reductase